MKPTLRLDTCGDWLTLQQYSDWRGEAPKTVYAQIKRATCFVMPATLKPLRWRRSDCEKAMGNADALKDRQRRASAQFRAAS